jgi:NAD(P)-dependent dehydrogenase (short-subunit alcohol dehydrogenase family)
MTERLAGRVAIVSGATKEVGAVIMRRLSDDSAAVIGIVAAKALARLLPRSLRTAHFGWAKGRQLMHRQRLQSLPSDR